MNARHTPSLESLLERHREGGAFPTYAELSALAAPAAPSEQAEALATIILGGIEGDELGNIDIEIIDMKRLEVLQYQMVRTEYPVYLHLYAAAPAAPLPAQPQQSAATDGLISVDAFYQDAAEDIAHALAQELEDAELSPNDFVTVNREKLLAIAKRVLVKAAAMSASTSPAPAPTEAQWISVEDSKPDLDDPVWLYEPGRGIWVGGRGGSGDGWGWCNCCGTQFMRNGVWDSQEFDMDDDYMPTHWMPLPAAPEATSPASRMGGITSKASAEIAAPGASTEGGQSQGGAA